MAIEVHNGSFLFVWFAQGCQGKYNKHCRVLLLLAVTLSFFGLYGAVTNASFMQGILKGEVSLNHLPPV
jgi:hypothetical protein